MCRLQICRFQITNLQMILNHNLLDLKIALIKESCSSLIS